VSDHEAQHIVALRAERHADTDFVPAFGDRVGDEPVETGRHARDVFRRRDPFFVESETRPGVRNFTSFSSAVAEIADARVFGGIHFRTACIRGNSPGRDVARYVMAHAMRQRGDRDDDDRDR
jgi:hypothetical protein